MRITGLLAIWAVAATVSLPAAALDAGAAKTEITPPLGSPLNGYGDRLGQGCSSVAGPLWARTLFLDDGETRLFVVNTDLCLINRELRDRVLELAPQAVPKENILLTATHTHNGQGGMVKDLLFRTVTGPFVPELLESTAQSIAASLREAYDRRQRASIGYGVGNQQVLSVNRRIKDGPIDEQIGVIRVDNADGAPIAIVGNFAAHPTSVPDDLRFAVSADYPGFYYDELERLTGGDCVALFLNGAEGNQTCANPEGRAGMERTASIGRLLAGRVKEIANGVRGFEPKLRLARSAPTLPKTIGEENLPADTVLYTLEIGDLLLTFFPGEPCVELGLEMRRRALKRGYGAQFTVGLANDHLMYFAPRSYYPEPHYESTSSFYGPFIEDWFYREFEALMSRGAAASTSNEREISIPQLKDMGGARYALLEGAPRELGYKRAAALKDEWLEAYHTRVAKPAQTRELLPDNPGAWSHAPSFINVAPITLPMLAIKARPLLKGAPDWLMEEVQGMAGGADLAFDAAWLTQCAPLLASEPGLDTPEVVASFAIAGERAGSRGALVGLLMECDAAFPPLVTHLSPESGSDVLAIAAPWSAGLVAGLNEKGLMAVAGRDPALGAPNLEGAPAEILVREILHTSASLQDAVARLSGMTHLRGYRILLASGPDAAARILVFGETLQVVETQDGLLLSGGALEEQDAETNSRLRGPIRKELAEEHIVTAGTIEKITAMLPAILRREGRHADRPLLGAVFDPRSDAARIAYAQIGQPFETFVSLSLKEGAP